MTQAPCEWTIGALAEHIASGPQTLGEDGIWRPARTYGDYSLRTRLRLAWAVFTGEADALFWPGQRTDAH
jgi:hypothetical protein